MRYLNAIKGCENAHILQLYDFFYNKRHLMIVTEVQFLSFSIAASSAESLRFHVHGRQTAIATRLLHTSPYRQAPQADSRGARVHPHAQHHSLRFEAGEYSHLRYEQVGMREFCPLERSSSLSTLEGPISPPIYSSRRHIRSTSSRVPIGRRRSFWESTLMSGSTFGPWAALLLSCSHIPFFSITIPLERC